MKCYAELPCENIETISKEIYDFLSTQTELITNFKIGWNFIDCKKLLKHAPTLLEYFRNLNLVPRHAAVTIVTETGQLSKHTDEPPVIAKINFPVINTAGWANRWYDGDHIIDEVLDMKKPMVFNSKIPHSVDKISAEVAPRIIASFTFYNEPLSWLKE
jgi:hypothetical protein